MTLANNWFAQEYSYSCNGTRRFVNEVQFSNQKWLERLEKKGGGFKIFKRTWFNPHWNKLSDLNLSTDDSYLGKFEHMFHVHLDPLGKMQLINSFEEHKTFQLGG